MTRSRAARAAPFCLLLFAFLQPGTGAAGEAAQAPPPPPASIDGLDVSVRDGLLSVRLQNAGLLQVMQELSRQSGMRIKLDAGASKRITLSFGNMPFEQGIRNLVRPLNYAMIWKKSQDKDGRPVEVLEELHIFREGHQGAATVELGPDRAGGEAAGSGSKVTKRVWDEETRQRMLEKTRVTPSGP